MSGKRRVGFALKKFLANTELRKPLKELISNAAAASHVPLVLSLPSPRQLLVWANNSANNVTDTQIDDVAVDSASVYFADFLREFSETKIAGVLMLEADNAELNSEQLSLYQPIFNIGDAYQWSVGVHAVGSPGATFDALDLMISDDDSFDGRLQYHSQTVSGATEASTKATSFTVKCPLMQYLKKCWKHWHNWRNNMNNAILFRGTGLIILLMSIVIFGKK